MFLCASRARATGADPEAPASDSHWHSPRFPIFVGWETRVLSPLAGKKNRPGTGIARTQRADSGVPGAAAGGGLRGLHRPRRRRIRLGAWGAARRVARRVRRPATARCPSRPHDRADSDVRRRRPGHTSLLLRGCPRRQCIYVDELRCMRGRLGVRGSRRLCLLRLPRFN